MRGLIDLISVDFGFCVKYISFRYSVVEADLTGSPSFEGCAFHAGAAAYDDIPASPQMACERFRLSRNTSLKENGLISHTI
jgi:hypothetical protein